MTQPNPFEGMFGGGDGAGGFDMNALLQQAQQMQSQLEEAQHRLAETTVDGSVAQGAVTVTVTGTGELAGVTIAPGTVDGGDADDLADLGELIVAAYRDAKGNADRMAAEALGPLAGGLGGGGLGGPGEQGPGGALPGGDASRGPVGF
jgi:nucleoid-associated protein EbfC